MINRLQNRMMEKYAEGFQAACDLLGVDSAALVKQAQTPSQLLRTARSQMRRRDPAAGHPGVPLHRRALNYLG